MALISCKCLRRVDKETLLDALGDSEIVLVRDRDEREEYDYGSDSRRKLASRAAFEERLRRLDDLHDRIKSTPTCEQLMGRQTDIESATAATLAFEVARSGRPEPFDIKPVMRQARTERAVQQLMENQGFQRLMKKAAARKAEEEATFLAAEEVEGGRTWLRQTDFDLTTREGRQGYYNYLMNKDLR